MSSILRLNKSIVIIDKKKKKKEKSSIQYTVGTFPKSNRKFVERSKIDTCKTIK